MALGNGVSGDAGQVHQVIQPAFMLCGHEGRSQHVADILGISPAIVRKHYAKWSQARQQRIDSLMKSVYFATFSQRDENATVN